MADDDWKTRVGIKINFSPDSSEDDGIVQFKGDKEDFTEQLSPLRHESNEGTFDGGNFLVDDILNEYSEYGSTPPRTRISRRLKEKKQREKVDLCEGKSSPKIIHAKTKRRNTLDSICFSELLERSENKQTSENESDEQSRPESNKLSKRNMKLLRGSERDLKLDMSSVGYNVMSNLEQADDRAESMPVITPQPALKVETFNRFLSLTSKPVACRQLQQTCCPSVDCPQSRVDFYTTFSVLIRMGSSDKQSDKNPRRHLSREEHLWQNELKDLIWLELQAWHANRTLTEQDQYLCHAREQVGDLLNDIMIYRFDKKSHFGSEHIESSQANWRQASSSGAGEAPNKRSCVCAGCLSLYCHSCMEVQNSALKDVEKLLSRLEAAEALYPSSKAFALQHPLYNCPCFIGRVKAMCLWYNMTKHHRLRLLIIGKLLMFLQAKNCSWPNVGDDDSGIATETSGSDDSSNNYLHSISRSASVEGKVFSKLKKPIVQFDMDHGSPSDSNNSSNSNTSSNGTTHSSSDGGLEMAEHLVDYYNTMPIANLGHSVLPNHGSSSHTYPYRKYIEQVLKTRGLGKALHFLEKLHKNVLNKAMVTLAKPPDTSAKSLLKTESANVLQNATNTADATGSLPTVEKKDNIPSGCGDDDEELRRYGYWSVEAQSISLPSYRSAFLFLARVPLELIHEFLRLRLEQKPDRPSVLSIRQLMREFKEGLRIAVFHRQRYLHLIRTALWDVDNTIMTSFEDGIVEFDQSMKSILEVYLNYLQQWVQMVQQERSQKNLLEEEWCFVKLTSPSIPGGEGLAGNSFCGMAMDMLRAIGDHLSSKVEQVTKDMNNGELFEDDCSPKQGMLFVCREFQGLFNDDRERALKAVAFAKALKKDLETCDISQEHQPRCCSIITDSLDKLKNEALSLCDKITRTILSVEEICDVRKSCTELEEMDRAALFSRCREILHLGYKFGFEYHKEVSRLVIKEASATLSRNLISFAQRWMHFVKHWCEKGRGLRPRWSNQGLDFLMTVCEPQHTNHLRDEEFEELKNSIAECISHVIGTAVPGNQNQPHTPPYHHSSRSSLESRSRGTSPSPHSRSTTLHFRSSRSLQDAAGGNGGATPTQRSLSVQAGQPTGSSLLSDSEHHISELVVQSLTGSLRALTRSERMQAAVKQLEAELEEGLREQELIGSIVDIEEEHKIHIKPRGVTFGWQRGIKIGQGRFGKVYTAVNNETGELMAMKEIQLQPNDHRTIRKVTEELRIFEGIQHNHLVRYYGVEIHREEMLIFMEFCTEGTLESLVAATESGLPETLIRRFTHQLLQAVCVLHHHGIVHRDIKSANIFLTDEGNCLKLGDFGSAVKIKTHTTLPGELKGFVGTQAYMAPEVFMKPGTEGHGRAADIWSAGCVVVEMASGKRPWPEFDSNYQIMFKVGMGESPVAPSSLSNEGHEFLALCLPHDPKQRSSAFDLLHHTFVKVDMDEDLPSIFEDHLKLNTKR